MTPVEAVEGMAVVATAEEEVMAAAEAVGVTEEATSSPPTG